MLRPPPVLPHNTNDQQGYLLRWSLQSRHPCICFGGGAQILWKCRLKKEIKKGEKRVSSLCVPHCTDFTYFALPTELSCLPGSLISKEHHSFLQQEGMKRREEEGGGFLHKVRGNSGLHQCWKLPATNKAYMNVCDLCFYVGTTGRFVVVVFFL